MELFHQGSETLSVDDGGTGPTVCNYESGGGAISTAFFTGSLGRASLTYQSDNGNSPPMSVWRRVDQIRTGERRAEVHLYQFVGLHRSRNLRRRGTAPIARLRL